METIIIGTLGVGILFILISLGIHVGVALGLTGMFGMAFILGIGNSLDLTVNSIYVANSNYALITLPLFILMGLLGSSGGITKSLYNNLSVWTGKIKGSLGIATVLSCAAFGAVCGSSFVTAAVFAKVSAPEMINHGYDKKLAYGLCASAGIIGMLIPPSVLAVVYGILSGLSVGKLLLSGIGPGILVTVLFSGLISYYSRKRKDLIAEQDIPPASIMEKIKTIPKFWPVILTGVVIFGGIFGGVFSPTEAAAVATVLIFVVLLLSKRKQAIGLLFESLKETGNTTAMIFLTMGGALIFSRFLVISGISQKIVESITNLEINKTILLVLISIAFLIMGTVMDSISMLTITIPIVTPVINKLGINPYFFATLLIYTSQIGIITPPFGLSVFTVKAVAGEEIRIEEIFYGALPFLLLLLVGLGMLLTFPAITTFLI